MYRRVTIEFGGNFQKIVIFCQQMRFFTKNFETFFSAQIVFHSLQLNAENRINIRAVYNEILVFKLFLYGIYMVAILSKFKVVYV